MQATFLRRKSQGRSGYCRQVPRAAAVRQYTQGTLSRGEKGWLQANIPTDPSHSVSCLPSTAKHVNTSQVSCSERTRNGATKAPEAPSTWMLSCQSLASFSSAGRRAGRQAGKQGAGLLA